MKKKQWIVIMALLVLAVLVLSACSSATGEQSTTDDDHNEGEASAGADDHTDEEDTHIETPAEYADLTNPFADDHEAAEAGAEIYEINCASCHGAEGEGDGPAAEALDPKPASLADAHLMEDMTDGALFWRVSEGGAFTPFNSTMPPWKDVLSEEQIWQVVTFIREFAEEDHD